MGIFIDPDKKDYDVRILEVDELPGDSNMDGSNICMNCLYWRRKGSTMSGKCHRHAPRRIPSKDSGYINDWALTNEGDFCGEYSPAAPSAEKAKTDSIPIKEIFKPQQQQQHSLEDTPPR